MEYLKDATERVVEIAKGWEENEELSLQRGVAGLLVAREFLKRFPSEKNDGAIDAINLALATLGESK